ncbi:MAG TPA: ATP-dependent zinc metalloprotease FtsH [Acidimicrobiia bacterium]|jgi:cell division protease FtsH|nr:ATP-dependent zinc metalloprotease FtsH [Acidimicrobiia bacterium]
MADTQRDRRDGRASAGSPERPDRGTPSEAADRVPWRVEGARRDGGQTPPQRPRLFGPRFWMFLLGLLVLNWVLSALLVRPPDRTEVPYTLFRAQVEAGNVASVTGIEDAIDGQFKNPVRVPVDGQEQEVTRFSTRRPEFAANDNLWELLTEHNVEVRAEPPPGPSLLERLLLGFGPTLLLVGLFVLLARRATAGAAGGLGGFGRSRARRYEPETGRRTTFADVAGIDEVEDEVAEIVDFLRNPDRYRRLGAIVPKGVLLAGPPGTGKTLLARAVAGEADVPFYFVSASEFIEFIVGVGASRVRDLFETAKKNAPAIIFIDELDSIGRARGGSLSVGGHDEREQTLNQILTEMDGFTGTENVIVLAATNRPEILDPALLRPGRFDRRLTISPPDQAGRRQILEVHVRGVALADDVDLDAIASATPGMVGADLANLVNEAALTAARRDHTEVHQADFTDALERIVLGTERRILLSAEDRRRTAFHEAGHALLGMLTAGADPVRKISIVPRGHALGVTFQSPDADRYSYSASYLRGRIAGMLAGRAAEELIYDDVTTGAENDLEQATNIAKQMVGRWGMSEKVGMMSVLPDPRREQPLALGGDGTSPHTRELVETEARGILDACYDQALATLRANRHRLDALVEALLQTETLDAADAYRAAGVPYPAEPELPAQAPDVVRH